MAIVEQEADLATLELPREFEDLGGLLEADLAAIVRMVTTRAHERLCLTNREFRLLQERLWNGLAGTLSQTLEPLTVESR